MRASSVAPCPTTDERLFSQAVQHQPRDEPGDLPCVRKRPQRAAASFQRSSPGTSDRDREVAPHRRRARGDRGKLVDPCAAPASHSPVVMHETVGRRRALHDRERIVAQYPDPRRPARLRSSARGRSPSCLAGDRIGRASTSCNRRRIAIGGAMKDRRPLYCRASARLCSRNAATHGNLGRRSHVPAKETRSARTVHDEPAWPRRRASAARSSSLLR